MTKPRKSLRAIAIRGIAFSDIEKTLDPAVGVIIDGVYIGTNTTQLLNSFDYEAVEILRGPQGTLFGRNTTAGVINEAPWLTNRMNSAMEGS